MKTLLSLFSGGGLADLGCRAAGYTPVGAVEWSEDIAGVYAANLGQHVLCRPVEEVDYRPFAGVSLVWASPCCTNASVAKADGEESEQDRTAAEAIARCLREARPGRFVLENVWGYRTFAAFQVVLSALQACGYRWDVQHVNAADFGGWELCPIHDTRSPSAGAFSVENGFPRGAAPDIVAASARMRPEDQARILARDVAASLVRATRRATAGGAACPETATRTTSGARRTTPGRAASELMSAVMSAFGWTVDTSANIGWWLNKSLEDPSLKERWSTTPTEIQTTTLLTICACIQATASTSQSTTLSGGCGSPIGGLASPGIEACPLCRFWSVPQTRRRLILRAVLGGPVPPLAATHSQHGKAGGLFSEHALLPWNGWYAAVEDLIPELPESRFAKWQLERLPAEMAESLLVDGDNACKRGPITRPCRRDAGTVVSGYSGALRAFLVDGQESSSASELIIRSAEEPAYTTSAGPGARRPARAFLVGNQFNQPSGTETRAAQVRHGDEPALPVVASCEASKIRALLVNGTSDAGVYDDERPAPTVETTVGAKAAPPRALLVGGANTSQEQAAPGVGDSHAGEPTRCVASNAKNWRAWLEQGRVVQMTPRALARFQSVPDGYDLPQKTALACRVIGNGVPPLLAERIAESLEVTP